jgi:hypothetical protein
MVALTHYGDKNRTLAEYWHPYVMDADISNYHNLIDHLRDALLVLDPPPNIVAVVATAVARVHNDTVRIEMHLRMVVHLK